MQPISEQAKPRVGVYLTVVIVCAALASALWITNLKSRGYTVELTPSYDWGFGQRIADGVNLTSHHRFSVDSQRYGFFSVSKECRD